MQTFLSDASAYSLKCKYHACPVYIVMLLNKMTGIGCLVSVKQKKEIFMKKIVMIMLFLSHSMHGSEADFYHPFNHASGKKITEFALMGQRCSGTKFTEGLIKKHFPSYFFYPSTKYGEKIPHKHHWPLLDGLHDYSFLHNENCLFILVVRNPYAWLSSLFSHKELVPYNVRGTFYNFISSEFKYREPGIQQSFSNILDARNVEMRNYLAIGNKVGNFLIVRYEDVSKNPKKFIDFMADQFNLSGKREVMTVEPYAQRKYKSMSAPSIDFIDNNLAWDVEELIGYSPKNAD